MVVCVSRSGWYGSTLLQTLELQVIVLISLKISKKFSVCLITRGQEWVAVSLHSPYTFMTCTRKTFIIV